MLNESSEPVVGPTAHKNLPTLSIDHEELPGLSDAALNHRVKLIIVGKVISNRAKDHYGDGSATIEISSIEHADAPKKENAATMHMDKLKSKLPKVDEKDDTAEAE